MGSSPIALYFTLVFFVQSLPLPHWPLSFPVVVSVSCDVCWLLPLLFPHGLFAENSLGYAFLPPVSRLTLYLARPYSKCWNIYWIMPELEINYLLFTVFYSNPYSKSNVSLIHNPTNPPPRPTPSPSISSGNTNRADINQRRTSAMALSHHRGQRLENGP